MAEQTQLPMRCVAEEERNGKSSPSWSCPEIIQEVVLLMIEKVPDRKVGVATLLIEKLSWQLSTCLRFGHDPEEVLAS